MKTELSGLSGIPGLVLVTGGAGYIGSHTCIEIMQSGHEDLVSVDCGSRNLQSCCPLLYGKLLNA